MSYWINSNTGDYISENNGVYKLTLISRYDYDDRTYSLPEVIIITYTQFLTAKGFIPIKAKRLFSSKTI